MEPAQRVLSFEIPAGISYIDIAESLSRVNRRAYRQGMQYAIGRITFGYASNPEAVSQVALAVFTAGDTWVVHNAWTKAKAHWMSQQRQARKLIGQSAKPTWEDFKVYLDDTHRAAGNVSVVAGDGGGVSSGEWDYSQLIWEADDNSIDRPYLHLIGGDVSTTDWGLILGYQQSRATVQPEDPDLPTEYSTNMYAKLATDENLVADEVANLMEETNDEPPYDQDDYPGNDTNSDSPWVQDVAVAAAQAPVGGISGLVAECGLLKFNLTARDATGQVVTAPSTLLMLHLVPGPYKGILAEGMGQ